MFSGIGVVWGGFDVLGVFLLTKPTPFLSTVLCLFLVPPFYTQQIMRK